MESLLKEGFFVLYLFGLSKRELSQLMEQHRKFHNDSIVPIVKWWESKRLIYNVLVGLAGFVSLITYAHDLLFRHPVPIGIGIVIYGFFANVFYSLGWMTEILIMIYLNTVLSVTSRKFAFGTGLIFSIFLTIILSTFGLFILTFPAQQ